jgi:hypothetical protein
VLISHLQFCTKLRNKIGFRLRSLFWVASCNQTSRQLLSKGDNFSHFAEAALVYCLSFRSWNVSVFAFAVPILYAIWKCTDHFPGVVQSETGSVSQPNGE